MEAKVADALGAQLAQAVQIVEEQVDTELKKLEELDEDDLEMIRRRRFEQMKKNESKKREMMHNGHGKYEEIAGEREFFDATKKSDNIVCLFFTPSSFRSKIVDKHLEILARKHLGTRFIKIDAEKAHFLSTRLNIRVIPTIASIIQQKTADYMRGFDDLGGTDEFTTETLEKRLAASGVISIEKKHEVKKRTKLIRCGDEGDSGEDW